MDISILPSKHIYIMLYIDGGKVEKEEEKRLHRIYIIAHTRWACIANDIFPFDIVTLNLILDASNQAWKSI